MRGKVEQLASHHARYQKENEVPNQRTPVVTDVMRNHKGEEEQERTWEKEQDRHYRATPI